MPCRRACKPDTMSRPWNVRKTEMPKKHLIWMMMVPLACAAADESPDSLFYHRANAAGLAEISGGELAQKNAKRVLIVNFGQMMVKDHGSAAVTLRGLAIVNHVELPTAVTPEQAAKINGLHDLTGDAFDKAYIEWQILAHRDAIALFKEESASGDDIDAKRFATEELPTLQSHLDQLLAMPVVSIAPAP
jgi:putative membrane protein